MKRNDFLCLNNIIYQIYNIWDFREMRTIVLSLLGTLVPNTCASFLLSDRTDSSNILCDPICYPDTFTRMENDYLSIENQDYSRWMLLNNKAMIIRDTDLLPEEDRIKTVRYQKCNSPYNLHYTIDLSIVDNNQLLGTLSLYRTKEMGDFSDDDLTLLSIIGEHLNARFYKEYTKAESSNEVNADLLLQLIREYGLTSREAEVLQMVFQDLSNDEIASQLYISPNTLKKHLQNLYRKLGATSRWEVMSLKLS